MSKVKAFTCPSQHQAALETVKNAVGIRHHYLDSWVYLFLANKKYDVKETIAKLERRDTMERTVFAKYTMTPSLKASMRSGIVQYIGRDKEGRPVLYVTPARDTVKSKQGELQQAFMDMFVSWAARCDPQNPTSTVTWLINQKDAPSLGADDLLLQKNMALRLSKFFPGVVARIHICHMSGALSVIMKPLMSQMPEWVREGLFRHSGDDIREGKLTQFIDAEVLPVALGGRNQCDNAANYEQFANAVEDYVHDSVAALKAGVSMKQREVVKTYGVSKDGQPIEQH